VKKLLKDTRRLFLGVVPIFQENALSAGLFMVFQFRPR